MNVSRNSLQRFRIRHLLNLNGKRVLKICSAIDSTIHARLRLLFSWQFCCSFPSFWSLINVVSDLPWKMQSVFSIHCNLLRSSVSTSCRFLNCYRYIFHASFLLIRWASSCRISSTDLVSEFILNFWQSSSLERNQLDFPRQTLRFQSDHDLTVGSNAVFVNMR